MVSYKKIMKIAMATGLSLVLAGCDGCGCNKSDDDGKNVEPGSKKDWKEFKAPSNKCISIFPPGKDVKEEKVGVKTITALREECTKRNKQGAGKSIETYSSYCVGIQFVSEVKEQKEDAEGVAILIVVAKQYKDDPKNFGDVGFATDKQPNNVCQASLSGLKYAKEGQEKKDDKKTDDKKKTDEDKKKEEEKKKADEDKKKEGEKTKTDEEKKKEGEKTKTDEEKKKDAEKKKEDEKHKQKSFAGVHATRGAARHHHRLHL